MKILLVEDDLETCRYLSQGLKELGHSVDLAHDGEIGLNFARDFLYDVVILDRMLPKIDGLKVLEQLRTEGNQSPVLILSALGEVDDRVEGLLKGGDDYLVKPYAFSELLARLTVLARRSTSTQLGRTLTVGSFSLDLSSQKLSAQNGQSCDLQPQEARLLEILMKNAGRVVTRTMLLEYVWDLHFSPQSNVVDTQVCRVRTKLSQVHPQASPIETVRGRGYRFVLS